MFAKNRMHYIEFKELIRIIETIYLVLNFELIRVNSPHKLNVNMEINK